VRSKKEVIAHNEQWPDDRDLDEKIELLLYVFEVHRCISWFVVPGQQTHKKALPVGRERIYFSTLFVF
jgi:hypothetical protein